MVSRALGSCRSGVEAVLWGASRRFELSAGAAQPSASVARNAAADLRGAVVSSGCRVSRSAPSSGGGTRAGESGGDGDGGTARGAGSGPRPSRRPISRRAPGRRRAGSAAPVGGSGGSLLASCAAEGMLGNVAAATGARGAVRLGLAYVGQRCMRAGAARLSKILPRLLASVSRR